MSLQPNVLPESNDVLQRVAALTRMLREGMRELGLDHAIKEAAVAIPDTRERLRYVARMTEQAANRTLNAAEQAQPMQEAMSRGAQSLDARWQAWFDQPMPLDQARSLVTDTRAFLGDVPARTQDTQAHLMDIIMAQDFQDLTGQVLTKMMDMMGTIESELIQVLIDNAPADKREEASGLLNGPQVNPAGRADVVTSQDQVDDLLASLGF